MELLALEEERHTHALLMAKIEGLLGSNIAKLAPANHKIYKPKLEPVQDVVLV